MDFFIQKTCNLAQNTLLFVDGRKISIVLRIEFAIPDSFNALSLTFTNQIQLFKKVTHWVFKFYEIYLQYTYIYLYINQRAVQKHIRLLAIHSDLH